MERAIADISETIEEIDKGIAAVRENLRELVEQGSANAGARDDELISKAIAEQEAQLDILTKKREQLAAAAPGSNPNVRRSKPT
jgi:uncharacterized coiled-coil protein SlyX